MKTNTNFQKFDRKYLFLEYNLLSFLPTTKKVSVLKTKQKYQKVKLLNKPLQLSPISPYINLIESTIQNDFILINNFWTFFRIYSKPKLFKFFPDRRSFFCYWIFPFVGFVTISHLNPGTKTNVSLIDDTFFVKKTYSSQIFSELNWDTIEYLNYKNLFLNNYFRNSNHILLPKSNTRIISEKSHMPISSESFDTIKQHLYLSDFRNKKQKIQEKFEKTDTQNLINLCQFYLTQTAEFIYNNQVYSEFRPNLEKNLSEFYLNDIFPNRNKDQIGLSTYQRSGKQQEKVININTSSTETPYEPSNYKPLILNDHPIFNKIKTNGPTNFLFQKQQFDISICPTNGSNVGSSTEMCSLILNPITESILGNYFNSKSVFNFYWYNLHLKEIPENVKLKKTKLIKLENNFLKKKTLVHTDWQTNEQFSEKVLPFFCEANLSKRSSFLSHNLNFNNFSKQSSEFVVQKIKPQLINTQNKKTLKNFTANLKPNIIDLEFKEENLVPLVINQLKHNNNNNNNLMLQAPMDQRNGVQMQLSFQAQPIISSKKANILLTTVLDKFKVDFGIKLEPKKLQHLFLNELKENSNVLYYLNKVLITSNNNFKTSSETSQSAKLNFFGMDTSKFEEGNSKLLIKKVPNVNFLIKESNTYKLTKKYLNLLLLKKSVTKSDLSNSLKHLVKPTSNSFFQIGNQIFELQKKLLIIKTNQLSFDYKDTSRINPNISNNFLSLAKNKIRKHFLISNLQLKFNNNLGQILLKNQLQNFKPLILNSLLTYAKQKPESFKTNTYTSRYLAEMRYLAEIKSLYNKDYSLVNLLLSYLNDKKTHDVTFLTNLTGSENFNPGNKILRKSEPIYFSTQLNDYPRFSFAYNSSASFFTPKRELNSFFENNNVLKKPLATDSMPVPFMRTALIKVAMPYNFPFKDIQSNKTQSGLNSPNLYAEPVLKNRPNVNNAKLSFSFHKLQRKQQLFNKALPAGFIPKKIRLFSTNVHINQKLVKNTNLQDILEISKFNSLLNRRDIQLKKQTVWSKSKIKDFNSQDRITIRPTITFLNLNNDQYPRHSFQNQTRYLKSFDLSSSISSSRKLAQHALELGFPGGGEQIKTSSLNQRRSRSFVGNYEPIYPSLSSWGNINLFNKAYYSNKLTKQRFQKLNYTLFSKQESLLNANYKIFLTHKAYKTEQSLGPSLVGKFEPISFLNFNFVDFQTNLKTLKTNKISSNFNHYIQQLSNRLKVILDNSRVYFIAICHKKQSYMKRIIKQNFYINLTNKKNSAFKSSLIHSFQQKSELTYSSTKKVKYYINTKKSKLIKKFLWTKNLIKLNYKPPIEKIFRNYLSSKYNKKPVFVSLKQQPTLSLIKKDSLFNTFKKKTKLLNLKITKKNLKSVHHSKQNSYLASLHGLNMNSNILKLAKKQQLFFKSSTRSSKVKNSIKTPYNIIKKIGFLFFRNDYKFFTDSVIHETYNSHYKKLKLNIRTKINIESYKQNYLLKNTKKQNLLKRLEKGKNLQKKRRQKKQARLTGRRKKRKRFFPRPNWLRFLLYKKFIKFRHFSESYEKQNFSQDMKKNLSRLSTVNKGTIGFNQHKVLIKSPNLDEDQIGFSAYHRYGKPSLKVGILKPGSTHLQAMKINDSNIRQNIYRTNKQNWGNIFFDIPNLEKITLKKLILLESMPIVTEIKFYNISSNLLQEFKKTMWKSYWLRTNFNNYINKINNYLNQIKIAVTESYVLINLKYFLFEILGLNFKEHSLKLSAVNTSSDFSAREGATEKKVKVTDNFNVVKPYQMRSHSLVHKSTPVTEFKLQSYEEFLTTLAVEKFNIKKFTNLKFGKLDKLNNFKLHKNLSKKYNALWYINVHRNFSNYSSIPASYTYLVSSNLAQFNDNLYERIQSIIKNIKVNLNVDGQNQLRAFNPGRLQSTKLSSDTFLTHVIKEWWARFENSFNCSFSIINIPKEIYLNQSKFRILWSLNKTNVWAFKKNTDNSFTWNKSKLRDQNKSNKTNKVINTVFNKIKYFHIKKSTRRQRIIETIFIDKFQTTNNKIKQLGLLIRNKHQLADFKKLLNSTLIKQNLNNYETNLNKKISNLILTENVTSYLKTYPKNYLQFWWSEINLTNYNLFQTDLSFTNDFFSVLNPFDQQALFDNGKDFTIPSLNLVLLSKSKINFIIIWGCLILFHVCLLFSLLNISQIRTFLKFQLLCVYKLTNIYLTVIYSTFKNIQQLKRNLFVYSNISSVLFKNLTFTKKSFLLMVPNSNKVNVYESQKILNSDISIFGNKKDLTILKNTTLNSSSRQAFKVSSPHISVHTFEKGKAEEYIVLTDFKKSFLNFFKCYQPQLSLFNKAIIKNSKTIDNVKLNSNYNNKIIFTRFIRPDQGMKTKRFGLLKLKASINLQLSRKIFLNQHINNSGLYNAEQKSYFETKPTSFEQEVSFFGTESSKYKKNSGKTNGKNVPSINTISAKSLEFASLVGEYEPIYESSNDKIVILPKLVSRKCDRYDAITTFILKKKSKSLVYYLPSIIENNESRKEIEKSDEYSSKLLSTPSLASVFSFFGNGENTQNKNFVFKILLNSTNLFSYNFLKVTLSLVQKVSLLPPRFINDLQNLNTKFLNQEKLFINRQSQLIENFLHDNSKSLILPNRYKTIATLVLNKYFKTSFYLSILFLVSILIKLSNKSLIGIYTMLFKLIDMLEGVMLIIYKSLEKPAELMIDFISEFFLIEWSADVLTFIPESFDIYSSSFSQKLMRNFRVLGLSSFFWQRRVLCFLDIFIDHITKPDTDLIIRQKKGIIFWDIWAEVLVQAAEIYSINLSSLFNIKEEQDLFLEKLLNDKKWDWSTTMLFKMSPLMELIKNSKPNGLTNNWSLFVKSEQIWRRWAVNPYYTYQGKDTDLFVESHPPKSFSQFKLMKYYPPVFEPVGNLVCQIYSGTFIKTVSKNLLLVGSRGTNKTLLIQAIAGETELKIMLDNANRYALTSKGVAIGMKLLKDVFDALALQAPCLFIIEDIHIIGERRPMLISDDENIKATENSFGVDQEEIHEKNQVIYQLSRHSIVHYKKPYKGDFSLLIPTNHFSLDLFLGFSPPKTRSIFQAPQNPLPIKSIEQEISNQNDSDKTSQTYSIHKLKFLSQIQLPKKELFSPPSTSPFTILLLKEQKKIKPKKIVSEMPWGGLSSDQLIQLPKASYSVRVKVALLADIAIRNLSVKLDRITDLLIIIDSVRSHRGFVVVATTHIPSILDPALRRPGRFDETLTIPSLPNVWSRWEILKASIGDFVSTLDLIDLAELFNPLTDTELSTLLSKTKLFLVTKQTFLKEDLNAAQLLRNLSTTSFIDKYKSIFLKEKELPTLSLMNSFGEVLKLSTYPIIVDPYQMRLKNYQWETEGPYFSSLIGKYEPTLRKSNHEPLVFNLVEKNNQHKYNKLNNLTKLTIQNRDKTEVRSMKHMLKSFNASLSMFKNSTNCLSLSYFQISKWFINAQLIKDQKSYLPLLWSTISSTSMNNVDSTFNNEIGNSTLMSSENTSAFAIYNSKSQLKNELLQLFAGKIGEFFVFYDIKSMSKMLKHNNDLTVTSFLQNGYSFDSVVEKENSANSHPFWNEFQSINMAQYTSLINTYGITETWRRASDLIFSIIYKRCLYNKNILIYRLFNLQTIKSLRQPPSPPVSTSFIAAKRYENYKRIESDFQNRITFSVHEKIQKHQQQRYIKTLYNKPIKKYFRSELQTYNKNSKILTSSSTNFESSFREISLVDTTHKFQSKNKSSRLSSSYFFFNNRINIRHRFYLINQWWNTQLPEHNAETTFLSEIDWRYIFIEGIGDLWMDFPDTDQHYNPRTRQWMLNSGYWSYWYNFDKLMTQEIYYQFLMENFYKAYNFLDTSREFLDLTCYQFLTAPVLKEIDFITYLKRFYKE